MSHDRYFLTLCKRCCAFVSFRLVLFPVLLSGEHRPPARIGDNSGTGVEVQSPAYALHEQQFFLARGREGFQHSAGYQSINRGFRLGQSLRDDTGDNQRMVVGHFCGIHASCIQGGKV